MSTPFRDITLNWLQKQFGYTNVSDLLMKKAGVWDKYFGSISERFNEEILSFDTCTTEALDNFWGKLYKISRNYDDGEGGVLTLTDDEFRNILKMRAFSSRWDGCIASMNEFLANLFRGRGRAYMLDLQNMKLELFVFNFQLTDRERFLFQQKDVLPRPAGVGVDTLEIDVENTIGFAGTEFQTFDNGVLFNQQEI